MHPNFQIPNVNSGLISLNPHGVIQSTKICRRKWTFKRKKVSNDYHKFLTKNKQRLSNDYQNF